jgi:hypothetical protein
LIKQRLFFKRVLLIFDDVDHSIQLEKTARKSGWFGLESRIIITTRNKRLLTRHEVLMYEVRAWISTKVVLYKYSILCNIYWFIISC